MLRFPCGFEIKGRLGISEKPPGIAQRGNPNGDECNRCPLGIHLRADWTICNAEILPEGGDEE